MTVKSPLPAADPVQKPAQSKLRSYLTIAAIFLVPFGLLAILWHGRCQKSSVQVVANPSGQMTAEQIRCDCGPSMAIASEVRLTQLKDGKSVGDATVLILPSKDKLRLAWIDDHTVTIQLPGSESQVVKYRREWSGVNVALIGDIISSAPKDIENF